MKLKDKLAEIEEILVFAKREGYLATSKLTVEHGEWLINTNKRLIEALEEINDPEFLCNNCNFCAPCGWGASWYLTKAKEALEDLP